MKNLTLIVALMVTLCSCIAQKQKSFEPSYEVYEFSLDDVVGIHTTDSVTKIYYIDYDAFEDQIIVKCNDEFTLEQLYKDVEKPFEEQMKINGTFKWRLIEISYYDNISKEYEVVYFLELNREDYVKAFYNQLKAQK